MNRAGYDKLWNWFGLSYSSFIVIPRSFAHAMPDEWQGKMADLLNEWDETWKWDGCGFDYTYVIAKKGNRFVKMDSVFRNYRHILDTDLEKYKARKGVKE